MIASTLPDLSGTVFRFESTFRWNETYREPPLKISGDADVEKVHPDYAAGVRRALNANGAKIAAE